VVEAVRFLVATRFLTAEVSWAGLEPGQDSQLFFEVTVKKAAASW
jgi:hypothetical protein